MPEYRPVDLFGGAIGVSLPSNFVDVSDMRQVPDNQEVYLDTHGFTSITFDILERVDKSDEEALKFHLHDVVEEDAEQTKVWTTEAAHLTKTRPTPQSYTLFATSFSPNQQRGHARAPDFVGLLLLLIRLEKQDTDITVVINVPHVPGQYNSAEVDLSAGKQGPLLAAAIDYRREIMESFEIRDWTLFVQE